MSIGLASDDYCLSSHVCYDFYLKRDEHENFEMPNSAGLIHKNLLQSITTLQPTAIMNNQIKCQMGLSRPKDKMELSNGVKHEFLNSNKEFHTRS